jgi:rhodanese-related sulfurtransferase
MGGHVVGSINIALNEIPERIIEIKKLQMPLILCCASGNRTDKLNIFYRNRELNVIMAALG